MHIWGSLFCPSVLLSQKCSSVVFKFCSFVLLSHLLFCPSVLLSKKQNSFVLLSPLLFCPSVLLSKTNLVDKKTSVLLSQKCSGVVFKFCSFVLLSPLLFCFSVLLSKKQKSFVLLSHPQLCFSVLLSNNRYSLLFVSIQIVTGPSLMSATFISAPNSPVPTSLPIRLERVEQKYS